jgi:PAS domain S-box-containing protein
MATIGVDDAFAALVEGVTAYAVFLLDENGRVASWNRGAQQLKGHSSVEAIGQPIERFYLPEDVADGEPATTLRRAAEHGDDLTHGWRLRRDGSRFWAADVTTALYDEHGRVRGYLKIVRDETARHAEDRESAAAMRWLSMLTENCPVGLILLEHGDGYRLWANHRACEMLGATTEEVAMDPFGERLFYPDGRPVPLEDRPVRRALRGDAFIESAEFLLRRPDGSTIPIFGCAAPVHDAEGRVVGAAGAFDDVSVLKRIEHGREQWTAIVAHELRQPLSVIVTGIGRLLSLRNDQERLGRVTELIDRNAHRLDRMVHDLLDVASIECGKLRVNVQPIDLEDHVHAAAERATTTAPQRHIVVQAHGALPSSRADPDRLDQILDNLLSNAVRYGEEGSDVTVSIDRAPDGVAVAVTSRGPGITAEQLSRLFRPFHHEAGAPHVPESVGLGLFITKCLVEANGGHIEAESVPGVETTFRFVLPAAA